MQFRNIVLPEGGNANPLESQATNQVPKAGVFSSMEFGAGNKTFKGDERGIWMGSSDWNTAPFRVDMQGNYYLYSLNGDGGYIMISADLSQILVNDGNTDLMLFGRQDGGF